MKKKLAVLALVLAFSLSAKPAKAAVIVDPSFSQIVVQIPISWAVAIINYFTPPPSPPQTCGQMTVANGASACSID